MNMKSILLVLLVLGLSFAGISVNAYTVSKDFFRPGEPGVATITVANPAGSDSVTGLTMSINSAYEVPVSSAPQLADLSAGSSTVVSVPFRVRDDAGPGIYLLNVVFQGYVTNPAAPSRTSVNTISIPITVVNAPVLSLSTDKEVIGGVDSLIMSVTNNGGPASNLKMRIQATSLVQSVSASNATMGNATSGSSTATLSTQSPPIAFYGTTQVFLPHIGEGETVPVNITLDSRSAPDGVTDVSFSLTYDDELGITHTDDSTLRMTVRNEKLDLAFSQLSDVVTRKEGTLTLTVKNDGPDPLKDVRLSFQGTALRLRDQNELKFGDLQPGATSTVSASVFADMIPGLNLVDSTVTWIEKDIQREESRTVPITITSDADVGVFLEARPVPLTLGSQSTISALVSNLGSYPIDNVDVSISSPALSSLDVSDRQYIGGLQADDFSTVQFTMQANATSAGNYPVYITVNYRDQSGEWKQKVLTQSITVHTPVAAQDNSLFLLLGVVVLAVAVWYFKFRK